MLFRSIEGSLQTRKWTDNAGVERFTTEVVLQGYSCGLTMLDSRGGGSENSSFSNDTVKSKEKESGGDFLMDDLDDEIPF